MSKSIMVYLSHNFGGNIKNLELIEKYGIELANKYDLVYPISPCHTTRYLYNVVTYERGINWCLDLLAKCDIMLVFGNESISKGCNIEKEFCKTYNIPIIEYNNFDDWYKNNVVGEISNA